MRPDASHKIDPRMGDDGRKEAARCQIDEAENQSDHESRKSAGNALVGVACAKNSRCAEGACPGPSVEKSATPRAHPRWNGGQQQQHCQGGDGKAAKKKFLANAGGQGYSGKK